ncbi:MerR family transcriptional regulator [Paraurantiacibacter namhicola]|uniref:HTH-type transcriptional repressor YcgE n=1 Tax=Paraurantiacibacter namhicola TaxID=645517 RepID=A0A1C7DAH2_9SPHN|nr:MerR family transcriptional regulator [Paraurantiacibacter namhicola]ANU08321.1 HTH-type transcriptional repressor YcgE [Paraurantiacibacter namhicola]
MSRAGVSAPVFNDGKADDALRTIGEVAAALGLKPHVLRYWEQQFPMLDPLKRSGGRRYYRKDDVALIQRIDRLVNAEGYTLKGAKQALHTDDGLADAPLSAAPAKEPAEAGGSSEMLVQLKAIRARLAAALEA